MVLLKTNMGDIKIELFTEQAPATVENFLKYVADDFYNGTIFHRVIEGFMIQGGGFVEGMQQKETGPHLVNEANNGIKNDYGTLAMARTPDPHSATAQFFINLANNEFLNFQSETPQGWGYCVFGKVVEGMDVVEKIKDVQTGSVGYHENVPVKPVIIESATSL